MQLSFQQWLIAVKRHRLLAIFVFIGAIALSVGAILFAPRSYTSEAKLMLRIGRESISIDPTASTTGDTLSLHHTRENEIKSAVGVMRSREIVRRVVEEVGEDIVLSGEPRSEEEEKPGSFIGNMVKSLKRAIGNIDPVTNQEHAIRHLAKQIFIGSTDESSVVSIAYTTKSPEVAQEVVASWVDNYIFQHAQANITEGSLEFFVQQREILKERISEKRQELEASKNASSLVTIGGQQSLLEDQVAKVREDLLETESQLVTVAARVAAYDEILNSSQMMITSEVTNTTSEAHNLMRDRLFELQVQEKNLESRLTANHPKLVSVRQQRADAETILDSQGDSFEEVTQTVNPGYQKISESKLLDRAEIEGLTEKRNMLLAELSELGSEIRNLNANEREIESLQNDVAILQGRLSDHMLQTEQARMKNILANERLTSVAIVQPATFQQRPVAPNKPLCAIVGIFAATAMALGLPLLIETRRDLFPGNSDQTSRQNRESAGSRSWADNDSEQKLQPATQ